jgi:hypothetical protein
MKKRKTKVSELHEALGSMRNRLFADPNCVADEEYATLLLTIRRFRTAAMAPKPEKVSKAKAPAKGKKSTEGDDPFAEPTLFDSSALMNGEI